MGGGGGGWKRLLEKRRTGVYVFPMASKLLRE